MDTARSRSLDEPFKAYSVHIDSGYRRGQVARVVGYADVGQIGNRERELSCKFADGTYKMIPERRTTRIEASEPLASGPYNSTPHKESGI